jgi:hypothetical protein
MDDERERFIADIVHDLTQPPPVGKKPPGQNARAKYRTAFTSGELAVLSALLNRGDMNIDDVPSTVAAWALMGVGLVKITKRLAQTPTQGTIALRRVTLTDDGLTVADFLYPTDT